MESIKTEAQIREEIKAELERKQSVQLKCSLWENPFFNSEEEKEKRNKLEKEGKGESYKTPKYLIKSNYEQVGVAWENQTKSGEIVINIMLNRPNAIEKVYPVKTTDMTKEDMF